MRVIKASAIFLAFAFAFTCAAQNLPQGAHVDLYFPHLADGGPAVDRWRTTFTFVNAGISNASVRLFFSDNDGNPLSLDFGSGASSVLDLTVPVGGMRVVQSLGASPTTVQGSVQGISDVPVQGTAAFRQFSNGNPAFEISAQTTLPTLEYTSPATAFLGVALANPWSDGQTYVNLTLYSTDGVKVAGPLQVILPPNGHTAGVLGTLFPGLPGNFQGVLDISGVDWTLPDSFLAWTLGSDNVLFSTLPPGAFEFPMSHWDRIWLVWLNMLDTAQVADASFVVSTAQPLALNVLTAAGVDAFTNGNTEVDASYGLSELIGDSDSELAFALGHALGHIYQQRNANRLKYGGTDPEADADQWAINLMLSAGYDPYAAAGALGKLAMATQNSRLTTQYDNMTAGNAYTSLNTRYAGIYDALTKACTALGGTACSSVRAVVHAHLPTTAPLSVPRPRVSSGSVPAGPGERRAPPPRK